MKFQASTQILRDAIGEGIIPSATYAIGQGDRVLASGCEGYASLFPEKQAVTENTLYDMASLSKLLSTTMVALCMIERGEILLSDTLSHFFTEDELADAPEGRREVSIFRLMTHTSGISPHLPLWNLIDPNIVGTKDFDSAVASTILRSAPVCKRGEQVHYSCMGYILLQKILERVSGKPLDVLANEFVFSPLGMTRTGYLPFGDNENHPTANAAATELSGIHGYYIRGHVHDENAHFLGGVSGNAGVFSDLSDMTRFARMLALRGGIPDGGRLISERMFDLAVRDYTPTMNESRGLGFQLRPPLPRPSAAGDLFAYGSYGHTGFTGTSLYVDSRSGMWVLLMTNVVHLGRDKSKFFRVRRQFHNSVMGEMQQ